MSRNFISAKAFFAGINPPASANGLPSEASYSLLLLLIENHTY